MKQVIQDFKSGNLYVDDVPIPAVGNGMILIENKYSLVSAGTERGTVKVAQASLLGKAKQRPDLVAQVIQNIKKEGLQDTLTKVRTKLSSLKALGYSSAGIAKVSLDQGGIIKPGDRVACGGGDYASHAEFVSVPQNLVVKVPDNVSLEEASFTTIGAIAMQGVRQAEPNLGDNVCVIGLGLIGQITCQLLEANGCRVFGVDLSDYNIELARELSATEVHNRSDSELLKIAENFTNGYGFDSVIITAAAPTNDPILLAADILRKKGKVVIVGAVKMDLPREPNFYQKELDLRMSCSYGPGRYDTNYEEGGNDYPYAYVRWTEQRNMLAFLNLLSQRKINIKPLISRVFNIENATEAYDLILGKTNEPFVGVLLQYSGSIEKESFHIESNLTSNDSIIAGFIGAGSFAQKHLIPYFISGGVSLKAVVTSKGITARNVQTKFNFENSSADPALVINDANINTVIIATQHNTHAKYTVLALNEGKNVFVEKPLAMNYEELEEVKEAYLQNNDSSLMVGFNRRFSELAQNIKKEFRTLKEPLVVNIRVNAGHIPKDHWTQIKELGGGRIVGEMCHFIDLMQFFTDALPVSVYAHSINSSNTEIIDEDNVIVNLYFTDGSVGVITYLANGDSSLRKEYIEVFGGGKTAIIDDFKSGLLYKNGSSTKLKSNGKGHKEEVAEFIKSMKEGTQSPISFESIYYSTLATFKVQDSLSTGLPQKVE